MYETPFKAGVQIMRVCFYELFPFFSLAFQFFQSASICPPFYLFKTSYFMSSKLPVGKVYIEISC